MASAHFGPARHWNTPRSTSVGLLPVFLPLAHATPEMEQNTAGSLTCEPVEVPRHMATSLRTDDPHLQSTIGEPGISPTVSPLADAVEVIDEIRFCELTGAL
jgi:hypothetical protein